MWPSCHNFNLKLIIKAVQIVDSSKITQMIRCAWNASSMHPAFRIVPQVHSDTVLSHLIMLKKLILTRSFKGNNCIELF